MSPKSLYHALRADDPVAAQIMALEALDMPSGAWARLYCQKIERTVLYAPERAWAAALALHGWLAKEVSK